MTSDKSLIRDRFEAQLDRYERMALVQQQICEELASSLFRSCESSPVRALEVGIGTGFLTRRLTKRYSDAEWFLNDIAQGTQPFVDKFVGSLSSHYLWGDAEAIDLPTQLDLIATASTIQWFDDLDKFVAKCAGATREGGYLAITTFGRHNFEQIKQLTGEGLTYFPIEHLTDILEHNGYSVVESIEYIKDMEFDSPTEVLKHIKATGVNGLKRTSWTKRSLQQFEQGYLSLCPDHITLTYHPIIIIAKLG